MIDTLTERDLETAIQQYHEDGAAVLRNVVSVDWIERLGAAIDRNMDAKDLNADFSKPGEGRFYGGMFWWLHQPEFAAFIRESGLSEIAAKVMGSKEVRFFYDQLLVKEPGTPKRTPWHQDLPYWPMLGNQILSIWVPIDAASPESGVVTYVKGSHRWHAFYEMENWSDNPEDAELVSSVDLPNVYRNGVGGRTLSDIRDHPEKYEFATWTVEPGDVILHHALAVHGAPGNTSRDQRRRAVATRWLGDDVTWDDSRPHFMRPLRDDATFPYPSLETGDLVHDPLFPQVWPVA